MALHAKRGELDMRSLLLRFVLSLALIVCFISVGIATASVLTASEIRVPLDQIVVMDMVIDITPDSGLFTLGETVIVDVDVENNSFVEGCSLTGYEITLTEELQEPPMFEFVSPATVTSISSSATFTLTATSTGTTTFFTPVHALYNCDNQISVELQDFAFSETFYVWSEIHQFYLPSLSRDMQN